MPAKRHGRRKGNQCALPKSSSFDTLPPPSPRDVILPKGPMLKTGPIYGRLTERSFVPKNSISLRAVPIDVVAHLCPTERIMLLARTCRFYYENLLSNLKASRALPINIGFNAIYLVTDEETRLADYARDVPDHINSFVQMAHTPGFDAPEVSIMGALKRIQKAALTLDVKMSLAEVSHDSVRMYSSTPDRPGVAPPSLKFLLKAHDAAAWNCRQYLGDTASAFFSGIRDTGIPVHRLTITGYNRFAWVSQWLSAVSPNIQSLTLSSIQSRSSATFSIAAFMAAVSNSHQLRTLEVDLGHDAEFNGRLIRELCQHAGLRCVILNTADVCSRVVAEFALNPPVSRWQLNLYIDQPKRIVVTELSAIAAHVEGLAIRLDSSIYRSELDTIGEALQAIAANAPPTFKRISVLGISDARQRRWRQIFSGHAGITFTGATSW